MVDEEKRLPLAPYLCKELKDLISLCWSADAYQRPKMEDVLSALIIQQQYDLSGSIDVAAKIARAHMVTPEGGRIYLGDKEEIVVGRAVDCDVLVESPRVVIRFLFVFLPLFFC